MTKEVLDPNIFLTVGSELGPVGGDLLVRGEEPPRDEHKGRQGGDAFGAGPDAGDGVAGPGRRAGGGGVPAPEVDDVGAVEVDAEGGAELGARVEVALEEGGEGLEACVAVAADLGHDGDWGMLGCWEWMLMQNC